MVTNSGDANGFVHLSSNSSFDPFDCTSTVFEISPAGRAEFDCSVEETDGFSGIIELSLEFEQVGETTNTSIGGWDTTVVMLSPRFVADDMVSDDEPQGEEGTTAEVAGKTAFNWMISAFVLILVGIGAISIMFAMRDRKEPEILEVNDDSLFNDNMGVREESAELEAIHPSIVVQQEEPMGLTSQTTEPDSTTELPALARTAVLTLPERETEILDSYLDLPGGGEYQVTDGITVYEHPDGSRWQQEEGGKFRRLA